MTKFGKKRWAFMERFAVNVGKDGVPQMVRWRLVQTPLISLYLHIWNKPDQDRDPHDHPWSFWSFVLWGGYVERLYERGWPLMDKWRGRWTLHRMPLRLAHIVTYIKPRTMTLVIVGPAVRRWGFWRSLAGRTGIRYWEYWEHYRSLQRLREPDGDRR